MRARVAVLAALLSAAPALADDNPRRLAPLDRSAPPSVMLVQIRTDEPAQDGGTRTTRQLQLRMAQAGERFVETLQTERVRGAAARPQPELGPVAPGTPAVAVIPKVLEDRALAVTTLRGVPVTRHLKRTETPALPQFHLPADVETFETWTDGSGQSLRTIETHSSTGRTVTTDYLPLPNADGIASEWFTRPDATAPFTLPKFVP